MSLPNWEKGTELIAEVEIELTDREESYTRHTPHDWGFSSKMEVTVKDIFRKAREESPPVT